MHEVEEKLSAMHLRGRGTVLGDIEARLTRNLCECILYFDGKICGIQENVPRSLKNAFLIPEERHLGLASLEQSLTF